VSINFKTKYFTKNSPGGNRAVTYGQTAGRTNDEASRFS